MACPRLGVTSSGSGTLGRAAGTLTWEARAPGRARSSRRRTSARGEPGHILPGTAWMLGKAGRCFLADIESPQCASPLQLPRPPASVAACTRLSGQRGEAPAPWRRPREEGLQSLECDWEHAQATTPGRRLGATKGGRCPPWIALLPTVPLPAGSDPGFHQPHVTD